MGPGEVALEAKIQEYVGDGHGGTKPWPGLVPAAGGDGTSVTVPRVGYGLSPIVAQVPIRRINWYELRPTWTTAHPGMPVVTLQPTLNEDADLFILEGGGPVFADGAGLIGSSQRLPTGSDAVSAGYVPDWVAFATGATGGHATCTIAIYGVKTDPPKRKHWRLESDWAWELVVNGPSLRQAVSQYNSDWNYFMAVKGTAYTVNMTAHDGDPDLYVYQDESTEYVGGDATVGGGSVSFTAAESGWHFIRAYGYGGANNDPEVWVTSP